MIAAQRRLAPAVIAGAAAFALLCAFLPLLSRCYGLPTESQAKRRVLEFAELINYRYDEPRLIYPYLTREYRGSISEADFALAFTKERSYPYLTPFFIHFLSIRMDADRRGGVAEFSQAARLPGMFVEIPFIYENGNYYMALENFSGFPDGRYLEKFEHIPRYLTEGWDWD